MHMPSVNSPTKRNPPMLPPSPHSLNPNPPALPASRFAQQTEEWREERGHANIHPQHYRPIATDIGFAIGIQHQGSRQALAHVPQSPIPDIRSPISHIRYPISHLPSPISHLPYPTCDLPSAISRPDTTHISGWRFHNCSGTKNLFLCGMTVAQERAVAPKQ